MAGMMNYNTQRRSVQSVTNAQLNHNICDRRLTSIYASRIIIVKPVEPPGGFYKNENVFKRRYSRKERGNMTLPDIYSTLRGRACEVSKQAAEEISTEAPLKLRKQNFEIKMCEDYEQAEEFMQNLSESIRYSGLLFLHFFRARFFAHPGGLAVADLAGRMAFLPLKFFSRELEESALGVLLNRMPALESLLKDPAVIKVVEDRNEFWRHLDYMSWSQILISPSLDLEDCLEVSSTPAKKGPLRMLRSIFVANDPRRDWNSDEMICCDDRWHVQYYSITPTFATGDPLARVIAGQLYAMIIVTCRYLIANNTEQLTTPVDHLVEFNYVVLHELLHVGKEEKLPAVYVIPKRTVVNNVEEDVVEMDLNEEERIGLLDDPPVKSGVTKPVKATKAEKNVVFCHELFYRSFDFGVWELNQEYAITMKDWASMEKADDLPDLEPSKETFKAMNKERCCEILKKVGKGFKLPVFKERLPGCPRPGILKPSPRPDKLEGEVEIVYCNHNDDMTWNFLASLQHSRKRCNSRRASPPPTYIRPRPGNQCHTTLAAALIRQYDTDDDFRGKPLPEMKAKQKDVQRRSFPSYMNSKQIREARKMPPEELQRLVAEEAGRPSSNQRKQRGKGHSRSSGNDRTRENTDRAKPPKNTGRRNERRSSWENKTDREDFKANGRSRSRTRTTSSDPGLRHRSKNAPSIKSQHQAEAAAAIKDEELRPQQGSRYSKALTLKEKVSPTRGTSCKRERSPSSSTESTDSSSDDNLDLGTFSGAIIRGMSRKCKKYLKGIETTLGELKKNPEKKDASTQTQSVFDRLSL